MRVLCFATAVLPFLFLNHVFRRFFNEILNFLNQTKRYQTNSLPRWCHCGSCFNHPRTLRASSFWVIFNIRSSSRVLASHFKVHTQRCESHLLASLITAAGLQTNWLASTICATQTREQKARDLCGRSILSERKMPTQLLVPLTCHFLLRIGLCS